MTPFPDLDNDAVVAATDLVGRTGARELQVGRLHDGVPPEQAAWYATATYQGAKVTVEDQPGPQEALEGLAERLLTGAQCQHCGGLIALHDDGAIGFPGAHRPDGTVWTEEQIEAAGQCRWRRRGPRWEPGCQGFAAEPGDEVHTTELLAQTLEAEQDPALAELITQARQGYYHDFLSPLATPEIQLVADLRAAGHEALAQRVIAGEFDASYAESNAWMASRDGQETLAKLGPLPPGAGRPTGASFWHAQQQSRRPR